MKKSFLVLVGIALFASGAAMADKVRDWHDLDAVHKHVIGSIHEMERARAANHYDMDGHGEKAEKLLHDVEHELHAAIESAKHAK